MSNPSAGAADGAIALAQQVDAGIVIVSGDVVAAVNAAFLHLFGLQPSADTSRIVGSTVETLAECEPLRAAAGLWRALKREPGRQHRCVLSGGRVVIARWHRLPSDGLPLFAAVFSDDGAGDARVRRRLRDHNRTLAELLATKTELVSALLHQLRTPLTAALSMAELLPEDTGDQLLDEALPLIVRKLRQIEEAVAEIATISGIENGTVPLERALFDLPGLLTEVVSGSGVHVRAAPTSGCITGDPRWIGRVVDRLITAVRVLGGHTEELSADLVGDRWRVALPLPARQSTDRLFTAAGSGGNSTALMLARAVVGRHGGKVEVETDAGTPYLVIWLPCPAVRRR